MSVGVATCTGWSVFDGRGEGASVEALAICLVGAVGAIGRLFVAREVSVGATLPASTNATGCDDEVSGLNDA